MNSEKILFENIFSVFEAVDIGIWVWDIDTNKIGWSRYAYTMFGYESYSFDVSFDVWANMVHPKDLDNVVKVMMNQLENRASFSVEFRLRCKDGSYKWIDGRGKATKYDSNGRFIMVVGTYTDITEKKRLEQFAENKLRLLEDAEKISHIGSWELDIKNNKLYWSDEIYRIFELDKEQFGASYEFFVSTIHPEDRTKVNDVYWKSVENKEPYYVEHRLLMPYGRIKYVIERGRTFYDEDGKPERSVGTVQDITEKVLLDEALKRQQEIFKAIFDKANVGICLTDREGKIIIFNSYISDLLGYTREELEGKYIEDITFQGDFEKEKILIKDILEGKRGSFRLEKRFIKKDGSLIWVDLSVALIYDKNGKVENVIGVVIDINDKKLLETDLIVAKELADQANQQKSIFLATMSHEIRTPLNGIIGIAQLLQMENLPPHIVEYVKHLNNASTHLYDLINDILDFSKIEAGEFDIKLEEFSVKGLLESVIALFTQRIKEKRLDFFAIINPEIPNILYGDPYRIKQIFTNLISNAIKFTEKGKVVVELDIKQKKDKEINLSFKVSDTGIGMNQEELHLLYQPFKQADSGITRKFGGTGLGLSIV
ncbi:MAG: PAS domain-containing protein, partial [Deferribacterales bacterium]